MKIKLLVASLAILSLTACKSLDTLTDNLRALNPLGNKIVFQLPPQSNEFAQFTQLSIHTSEEDTALGFDIKNILQSGHSNEGPYFSNVLMSDEASQGQLLLSVSAGEASSQINYIRESRIKCPGKKVINTCKNNEGYQYYVNCAVQTVSVSGKFEAKSNDNVVIQKFETISTEEKACNDSNSSLPAVEQQLVEARQQLAEKLVGQYIPTTDKRASDIEEPEDLSAQDQLTFDTIEDLVGQNNLNEATRLLDVLLSRRPNDQALIFNVAYVNQAMGNFDIANEYYAQVSSLDLQSMVTKYKSENDRWLAMGYSSIR